jgi:hypothetical protein
VVVCHAASEDRYLRKIESTARHAQWWDPRTRLAFIFWELRTIFAAVRNDGQSDWKAMVIIVVFEILAIVGLTDAAAVYLGPHGCAADKRRWFISIVAPLVSSPNMILRRSPEPLVRNPHHRLVFTHQRLLSPLLQGRRQILRRCCRTSKLTVRRLAPLAHK